MGARNYLITGASGTGKTAIATELQRRGCHVVHGDRELAYRGDPATGAPLAGPAPSAALADAQHLWDEARLRALAADATAPATFFCGGARNQARLLDVFDAVFLLQIDRATLARRLDARVALDPTDWGGRPAERDVIMRAHAEPPGLPGALPVDATRPLARVVDDLLARCGLGGG